MLNKSSKERNEKQSIEPKKVQFKNTVIAFINDGIDFWKYRCQTEPLRMREKTKKYNENFSNTSFEDKHGVKNKRKEKKTRKF